VIAGSVYLDRGRPVTVLAAWNGRYTDLPEQAVLRDRGVRVPRTGPHNVLIERADGSREIRGFRGLLVPPGGDPR
jgi:hypothetical protein